MMKMENIQKGFTLLEIIIVVGIISILPVGAMTILDPVAQFQKANDLRRKSDLATIQKALEQYYGDTGQYPQSTSDYKIIGLDGKTVGWGAAWSPYLNIVPKDPNSLKNYVYGSGGQSYYLYATLDRGNDPQSCQNLNANGECQNVPAANLCGTGVKCNYGVTSPNVSP